MAAFNAASSQFPGTGPYRRIWSTTPMSAIRATVFLPGIASGGIQTVGGDTAFVYSGGWGSAGQAVDAGFMHNPGTDTWSVFIKLEGHPLDFGADGAIRLKPNQNVTFTFWIPQDQSLRIEATGEAVRVLDATHQIELGLQTLAVQVDGAGGFAANGTNVILKRMTSIAQVPENLRSGSKLQGVAWTNVACGIDPNSLALWSIVSPGGTLRYTSNVVHVDYVSDHEETVSIDLS